MTSVQVSEQNYKKLGQIYNIFKGNHGKNFDTSSLKAIIGSMFNINCKLPSTSFVCCKKPEYSGNTALHLLVELYAKSNEPYLELLIQCGADFTCKNDNGYTPLLLAFSKGFTIHSLIHAHLDKNNSTNPQCKNGISHFHVACSSNQIKVVDFFLKAGVSVNKSVNNNSPIFSGYTPLHFAMDNLQFETVELLLVFGAKYNTKDAHGLTPLDLVIKKLSAADSTDNLQIKNFLVKIAQSTMLVNLLRKECSCFLHVLWMIKYDNHVQFGQNIKIPTYQGYTLMHFALLLNYNADIVIQCLEQGANLLFKAENGTTAFDLCLKKFNLNDIIRILLTEKQHQLSQLKFTDETLLLNFLQAMKTQETFERFLMGNIKNLNTFIPFDSPILTGYNLLHLTVLFDGFVDIIFSYNIDFRMINAEGVSPLHLAFRLGKKLAIEAILKNHEKMPLNCVDRDNLSHLHIACVMGNCKLVELLLCNGADPNLQTHCDLQWKYNSTCNSEVEKIRKGSTPLHIAVNARKYEIATILLCSGAHSYVPDADGITPFRIIFNRYNSLSCDDQDWKSLETQLESVLNKMLKYNIKALTFTDACLTTFHDILSSNIRTWNDGLRKAINELYLSNGYKKLGLTKLQLACATDDYSVAKEELLLNFRANVNKPINIDSPIWPGNTALHILSIKSYWSFNIANLLLEHETDITLKNINNLTPLHLSKHKDLEKITYLMKHKFINLNPVNDEGLSHFHLCCKTSHSSLLQKFLDVGVDVNANVDYFADCYAGYTPLHFAIEYGSKEGIEFLLRHGADPKIENGAGLAPLHLAALQERYVYKLDILISYPTVDVAIKNAFGESVFEMLLKEDDYNKVLVDIFLNNKVNTSFAILTAKNSNDSCLIATAASDLSRQTFQRLISMTPDLTDVDDDGQNAIHYATQVIIHDNNEDLERYTNNINSLIRKGCEINHKDTKGKTALHYAASLKNPPVVGVLMNLGADTTIKDDAGKTPYAYIDHNVGDEEEVLFADYLRLLQETGLNIDESDKVILDEYTFFIPTKIEAEKRKFILKLKKLNFSFSDDYFFTREFVVNYKRMPVSERWIICNIYKSTKVFQKFPATYELYPYIKLQFRKAQARVRLLEPAAASLQTLANIAILPEPCSESIFYHLENDDLMNIIRTVNGKLEFGPLPDNY